jgi:hypothetical protein
MEQKSKSYGSVTIGCDASSDLALATAIKYNTKSSTYSTAIGRNAQTTKSYSVAIGMNCINTNSYYIKFWVGKRTLLEYNLEISFLK